MTVRISIRGNPFFHGFSFPSFRFILLSLKGMNEMTQEVRGLMSEGNIWKQLILFSVPLVLGNIFQQLYNAVDSLIVGNFVGKEALAAVTSSSPIINLLISFFMGLSVGAGVVIARYFGARDETGLSDSIHTSMCMIVIAGIVMTFAGVLLTPFILRWIGVPDDVMADSILYLRIYFYGILGVMIYNMGSGVLRALGDSRTPLFFLILSSLINVALDYGFVVWFHMGIAGVAWATLIAQGISAVLIWALMMKGNALYRLRFSQLKIHGHILGEVVRVGLPSGIQNAIVSFSNLIVQSNINAFGSAAMAGCGAYTKIDGFAILPAMSYSMAITTFTGQNLGAGKPQRVRQGMRACLILTVCTSLLISALLFLFGDAALRIFSNDPQVLFYGHTMLTLLAPGYFLLAISHAVSGVLRGANRAASAMVIIIACWCGLRMAWIMLTVPLFHSIETVLLGWPLSWLVSTVIFILYYRRGSWLQES